jgi:hypothetical protein
VFNVKIGFFLTKSAPYCISGGRECWSHNWAAVCLH